MKTLVIISTANNRLSMSTHLGMTLEDFTVDALDEIHGRGNWMTCYDDELPADFSIDTYTIIDGELVHASDEVMTARAAAKIAEQNAAIRETRRQLYDDPQGECAPLYWDWVETQSPETFDKWVAAKNIVREQNPYVDANN